MKKGVHTIRSGFSDQHNPTTPRRYILDNGDYKLNMRVTELELIPTSGALPTNNHDVTTGNVLYFVLATSSAGATPATNLSVSEESIDYGLRLEDSRQIGWGFISQAAGYHRCFVDPDHIIAEDLYVTAYCMGDTGNPETLAAGLSFMIKMERVKESGSEALLSQIKVLQSN